MSRRFYGPEARRDQRWVFEQDGSCMICGSTKKLGVHHIQPASLGGEESRNNYLTTCDTCEKHIHSEVFDITTQGGLAFEFPGFRIHNIYLLRELARGIRRRGEQRPLREEYLSRRAKPKLGKHGLVSENMTKRATNIAYMLDNGLIDTDRLPWVIGLEDIGLEVEIRKNSA
jgi:hypothetical protein